jgi:NTE family protein
MTTAFVLSGGGSLGAVQVGMLEALVARGERPDLLIGTSVGALNAAFLAGRGTDPAAVAALREVWLQVRRRDVFPLDPRRFALAVAGRRSSLCSNGPLRELVARNLTFERLEEAAVPVHVVATDIRSGEEVLLSAGDAVSAVLASAAVPGVFPVVEREGLPLVDGGVADNAAVSQAVALGADRVVVLPSGVACALPRPPSTALATAMHALTLVIEQRLVFEVRHLAASVAIEVIPPLCPLSVSAVDFSHTAELIERARQSTEGWLGAGGPSRPGQERYLSLHHHGGRSPERVPRGDGRG